MKEKERHKAETLNSDSREEMSQELVFLLTFFYASTTGHKAKVEIFITLGSDALQMGLCQCLRNWNDID